jgi:ribosomal protein S18 acetylase RimI-like enzyme
MAGWGNFIPPTRKRVLGLLNRSALILMDKSQAIIIRKLRAPDLPALEWEGELIHFRNLFAQAYEQYQQGEAVLWVAENPSLGIIAQLFVQLDSHRRELANGHNRAYIYGFRVRSAYRNLGIGSQLLETAEKDLKNKGYQSVTLNVGKHNPNAKRLYERLGYRVIGSEPGRWSYLDHLGRRIHVCEPAFRMEKRL